MMLAIAVACTLTMASCEENGPESRWYYPDRSSREVFEDIMNADKNNGFYYNHDADLFYRKNGEWCCAGKFPIYSTVENNQYSDECNNWVYFGGDDLVPACYNDRKYGYIFRVTYKGVDYYY